MKSRHLIVTAVIVILVVGWMIWSYAVPHTTLSEGPMSPVQAQALSPIPLPSSATNVRVATYRHLGESVVYLKFDAPLSDCRILVNRVMPGAVAQAVRVAGTQAGDLPPPERSKRFTAEQLGWFDANRVTDGERYVGQGGRLVVVVAFRRGVNLLAEPTDGTFYFRLDD